MRATRTFIPTLRQVPKEAEVQSHVYMLRAGLIRQLATGLYTFLPFGWRALKKVEQIVREEMDRAGAQEILMPALQPQALWERSGRWETMGPELMRLQDRNQRQSGNPPFSAGFQSGDVLHRQVRSHHPAEERDGFFRREPQIRRLAVP